MHIILLYAKDDFFLHVCLREGAVNTEWTFICTNTIHPV